MDEQSPSTVDEPMQPKAKRPYLAITDEEMRNMVQVIKETGDDGITYTEVQKMAEKYLRDVLGPSVNISKTRGGTIMDILIKNDKININRTGNEFRYTLKDQSSGDGSEIRIIGKDWVSWDLEKEMAEADYKVSVETRQHECPYCKHRNRGFRYKLKGVYGKCEKCDKIFQIVHDNT